MLRFRHAVSQFMLMFTIAVGSAHAAEDPKAVYVVYEDGLKDGWQNWSWAEVTLESPAGNAFPIKVSGEPWTALALAHHDFFIDEFSILSFFINGGLEGNQTLAVKLIRDGQPIESNYVIRPEMKKWSLVEIPLAELGASEGKIEAIWVQAQHEAVSPYYITRIYFY